MLLSWLPLTQVRASASSRAAALSSSRIESHQSPDGAITWIAGGRQTKGALPVRSKAFDGALYSSRGRGYARYNEDAAVLFTDRQERVFAAAFDQAGGLGGRIRGAASQLAARRVFEAFQTIAQDSDGEAGFVEATVYAAFLRAHEELVARGEGEVTTGIVAVATPTLAVLVNSGDSGAMHFDAQGNIKGVTTMHEHDSPMAVGCLTHALGLQPEAAAPDPYRWELSTGDWLLLASDGLLDAGLSFEELGRMLREAESAEQAVNRTCTRVLRMMSLLRAKPDNLTVVAVRRI